MTKTTYEIAIVGGACEGLRTIRRGRSYRSYDDAATAAARVAKEIVRRGYPLAAHPVLVYGPGCGPDGRQA